MNLWCREIIFLVYCVAMSLQTAYVNVNLLEFANPRGINSKENYCRSSKCNPKFQITIILGSITLTRNYTYQEKNTVILNRKYNITITNVTSNVRFLVSVFHLGKDHNNKNESEIIEKFDDKADVSFASNGELQYSKWKMHTFEGKYTKNHTLKVELSGICAKHHYGVNCKRYCEPVVNGKFTCNEFGQKVCIPGYTGDNCEQTYCTIKPGYCNGGVCHVLEHRRDCSDCPPGYKKMDGTCKKPDCEVDQPCENGGTCTNNPQGYKCTCPAGFTGQDCEVNSAVCNKSCENGGRCVNNTCQCPEGQFTGDRCHLDYKNCQLDRPCQNGGTCTEIWGGYFCTCPKTWMGRRCESDVNECKFINSNTGCLNGGECNNTEGSFQCKCPTNWKGKQCEINVDECSTNSNNCSALNTQKCIDTHGGYICSCKHGWEGDTCEMKSLVQPGGGLASKNVTAVDSRVIAVSGTLLALIVAISTALLLIVIITVLISLQQKRRSARTGKYTLYVINMEADSENLHHDDSEIEHENDAFDIIRQETFLNGGNLKMSEIRTQA